ncbi:MAG: GH39 family glycosyl hydrolase [Gammaproteobacteria bacterium]
MTTTFTCDLSAQGSELPHVWERIVGSDHALMALCADWQGQLQRSHDELGFRYVRFHGILDDDVGTLLCEVDTLRYGFFNSDQIFDFLLKIGMKPFVELSFMPSALASGDATVFKYRGNVTPPKLYPHWGMLIRELVGHWVDRYGLDEVRQWFFEVWNEPNLKAFWTGDQADYFKLYRTTAFAIKAVDDQLRVGGPASAANAWISDFLDYCSTNRVPVDFVSTHQYPTDAFGQPGDDTETQLSKSRRSVLRDEAREVHGQAQGKPVYYTEWSTSSNPFDPLHDEPYAAAYAVKANMEAIGLVEGYSYWTFSDIFQENYLSSVPFHGGFGMVNIYGVAKPVYRAYQLLRRLGSEQLPVRGEHPTVDVWVARADHRVDVLCTNGALPRHPIAREALRVTLAHAARPACVNVTRIGDDHAHVKKWWAAMGEPRYLSARHLKTLHAASELKPSPLPFEHSGTDLELAFEMPEQAVAMITIDFDPSRAGEDRPQ